MACSVWETTRLQSGDVIPAASIVWKTYGALSAAKDNVVLYPTSYSATHGDLEWLIGPDGILDPARWFIVIPNMFGNGLSSSPSNTVDYPSLVTSADNVHAQRRLLREVFGVERLAGVYGWSMGAQQAYHWAALYPDAAERIVVVCGSARTAVHNQVFLLAMKAILESAPEHLGNGRFSSSAARGASRVWPQLCRLGDEPGLLSRRAALVGAQGASSLDDFLRTQWEARFAQRDAANLYAQLQTWIAGDISANPLYDGDLTRALERDQGARAPDAKRDRPVFPRRGQRSRAAALEVRGAGAASPASGATAPVTRRRTPKTPCSSGSACETSSTGNRVPNGRHRMLRLQWPLFDSYTACPS